MSVYRKSAAAKHPRYMVRERVLQALFIADVQGEDGWPEARRYLEHEIDQLLASDEFASSLEHVTSDRSKNPLTRAALADYAARCLEGAWRMRERFDADISTVAVNWSVPRLAVVERCLLRLALYEMTQVEDIPPAVAVDQAIELAKRYGTAQSANFVGGVLGRLVANNVKFALATSAIDAVAKS